MLSEASAAVLSKVETMRKWKVAPPMTRGSHATSTEDILGAPKRGRKKKTKVLKEKSRKIHTKKAKKKLRRTKAKKSAEETMMESKKPKVHTELTEASFRRNRDGRAAVMLAMQELYELDNHENPNYPCFNDLGFCRLKFDGAEKLKWEDMLDASPKALECMHLGFSFILPTWL